MNIPFLKKKKYISRNDSRAFRDWSILLVSFFVLLLITSIVHFMGFMRLLAQTNTNPEQIDEVDITIFQEAADAYSELESDYFNARDNAPSIPPPTR